MPNRTLILSVFLLAGCPSTSPPPDAGSTPDSGTSASDVPLDAHTPSIAGGPCEVDADCAAGFCSTEEIGGAPGGACALACTSDDGCPVETRCSAGYCRTRCETDAECRAGFACYDRDGDGTTECGGAGSGAGAVGAHCRLSTDCGGGTFAFCEREWGDEGYCTDRCMVPGAGDCAASAHCTLVPGGAGGLCLSACAADADCLPDQVCDFLTLEETVPGCVPRFNPDGLPLGALCTDPNDCSGRGNGMCTSEANTTNGYCTTRCGAGGTCDPGSHCSTVVNPNGSVSIVACLADCTTNADCAEGLGCVDGDGNGSTECDFAGIGTGLVGDACTEVADCAGGADAVCLQNTSHTIALCTIACAAATCPDGSTCRPATGGPYCFENCTTTADCTPGLTCRPSGACEM